MELRLHPRNQGFEWLDHTGPLRRLSSQQVRAYDEQGFFVLEHALPGPLIDELVAEIDPIEALVEGFLQTRKDGRLFIARAGEITFSTHLVTRSRKLRDFVSGPLFQDICHDLIGPDARLYWDQAVYKKPGTALPFPWHQDNGYTYVEPQQYLTCWVSLTDATTDNGCPWVLPGLHRGGTLAHETTELGFVCVKDPGDAAVAAPVGKGGIVVFSSLTPHATGANVSQEIRKSYIVQFAPAGARSFPRAADGSESALDEGIPCDAPDRQFPVLVDGAAPGR